MSRRRRKSNEIRKLRIKDQRAVSALHQLDVLFDPIKRNYVISDHPNIRRSKHLTKVNKFDNLRRIENVQKDYRDRRQKDQKHRKRDSERINDLESFKKRMVCNQRSTRRQVIFANSLQKRGSGAKYRKYTAKSKVRC